MDAEGPSGIFRDLQSSRRGDGLVPIDLPKEAEAESFTPTTPLKSGASDVHQASGLGCEEQSLYPILPEAPQKALLWVRQALSTLSSGKAFIILFCRCSKFTMRLSLSLGASLSFRVWFLFFDQAHSLFLQNLHWWNPRTLVHWHPPKPNLGFLGTQIPWRAKSACKHPMLWQTLSLDMAGEPMQAWDDKNLFWLGWLHSWLS